MVRTISSLEYTTATIHLRNGVVYENRDIPQNPFGDSERYISFWDKDELLIIPMDLVALIKLNPHEV